MSNVFKTTLPDYAKGIQIILSTSSPLTQIVEVKYMTAATLTLPPKYFGEATQEMTAGGEANFDAATLQLRGPGPVELSFYYKDKDGEKKPVKMVKATPEIFIGSLLMTTVLAEVGDDLDFNDAIVSIKYQDSRVNSFWGSG